MQIKKGDIFIANVATLQEQITVLQVSDDNYVEYQADTTSLHYEDFMPLSRFLLLLQEFRYVKQ